MAVMTNKNEMKRALDFLNELKTNIHWDDTRIKYIDIAIDAVERDIKEFDSTHKMIICPQCGYYLIEDLINDMENKK